MGADGQTGMWRRICVAAAVAGAVGVADVRAQAPQAAPDSPYGGRLAKAVFVSDRVPEALAEHEPLQRPLRASTWGEEKDLRTWDSRPVEDLAWGARRLELRVARALSAGLRGAGAERAVRELLATQASDWAFLDQRRQAGDYAFLRAISHSHAALEAIDSPAIADPRMRALSPDLSLSPLLQP